MSCCPEGSWGALVETSVEAYTPKGTTVKKDDLDIYHVGQAKNGKCIIWNYDIFGLDGGRTRMFCDIVADEGYLVILPDFYRDRKFHDPKNPGTMEFLKDQSQWTKLKVDFEEKVLPFAKENGAVSFGVIGTCWGTYMVVRQSAYSEVKAGVSMHPSHTLVSKVCEEEERDILQAIICPQLFMPASNDPPNVKPGGIGSEVLGDKLDIVVFDDMVHGWTTRGDMKDEKVNRDVKKAMKLALQFFKKHV